MDHAVSSQVAQRLTVIIPAYNEEDSIAATIASVQAQTAPPKHIIVVDDFSSDRTSEIARGMGVQVIRPAKNTGSKAGAQNIALQTVTTEYTMAIDADTTLAPDALQKLLPPLLQPAMAAVCGFVLPRHVKTLWERGRYVEYLLAFSFYKPVQNYFGKPLISSGCFSAYNTAILRQQGGWSERTRAEDMDLTWSFYEAGYKVQFVPEAMCYPIEPHNLNLMSKQLKRWSHGFVQNVQIHWRRILPIPYLSYLVGIALWDATIASIAYLILLPVLAIVFANPLFLLGYIIDIPAVALPVLLQAARRGEAIKALASLPSFFALRTLNGFFILEALWSEVVLRKPLLIYEKGH